MIQYNPKDWFTFIFRFHKADTFRKLLPLLAGMAFYATLVIYLEIRLSWVDDFHVQNIIQMHSLLGFAISIMLVFRTNTAYDRWWEARRWWGTLVNNSRNLAIKLTTFIPEEDHKLRLRFSKAIGGFAIALHKHLRKETIRVELFELDDEDPTMRMLDQDRHVPAQLAELIYRIVNRMHKGNAITPEQYLALNTELSNFMEICGACERIKNTPIPFSYSGFIKKFVFFYVMSLPFGFGKSLGYIGVPVVVFIFYVLASLELIAEEIEDPFSGDENDIPTEKLAEHIRDHVKGILERT